jgi:hypothetical protein
VEVVKESQNRGFTTLTTTEKVEDDHKYTRANTLIPKEFGDNARSAVARSSAFHVRNDNHDSKGVYRLLLYVRTPHMG